ncbi:LuxR C-terminal-related transcriptional regulator [Flavobacteriaceae bacterium]|nr:LuxR C-terminal-related transcriptional regulator [Flavobacteriaceae bacterium]
MKITKYILVLLASFVVSAQEHPPVMSYNPDTYVAQNQNWSISQTSDQTMYFANNSGLLEYDGTNWKLYPVPDKSIVRSVKAINNLIYTGSYMDFGVWKRNNKSILEYTSLVQQFNIELVEDEQFWDIMKLDNWLIFQSLSRIYLVNELTKETTFIDSDQVISNIFEVDGVLFFNQLNNGLYKIIDGNVELVSDHPKLVSSNLVEVFELEDQLLIITASNGFYLLKKNKLTPWKIDPKVDLNTLTIYSATILKDSSIVIGTVSNGLFHLSSQGNLKYDLNFEKGLSNNTVLSVFEDYQNNLWLGLDIGVSHVNLSSQFVVYNDTKGAIGTVYTSVVYENYLYLGTNQGLFYKRRDTDADFSFIEGTNGQVWNLKVIDDQIFCGHDRGTILIKNQKVEYTIGQSLGTWDFKPLKGNPNIILQGNYNGLSLLEKSQGKWRYRNKIKGFDIASRFYQYIGDQIFVNHELRGLFKLSLNKDLIAVSEVSNITPITKGNGLNFFKFSKNYYYTSSEDVYNFNTKEQSFSESEPFKEILNEYTTRTTIMDVKDSEGLKWCFADDNILIISAGSVTQTPKVEIIPIAISSFRKVVSGFENLTKIDADQYLLGSAYGYFIFNSNTPKPNHLYNLKINSVQASKINEDKFKLDFTSPANLDSESNNIYINYSIPHFDNEVIEKYSYKLTGWSNSWSEWQSEPQQVFENLPYGSYEFKVKGKIGNSETLNTASYSFVINRPWYLSNTLVTLYVVIFIVLWILIHNLYKRHYRKQQQQLIQKSHEQLALKELEASQKFMQLTNEKLKLDIESKNRELAVSTMSLIKKNEFLNSIKSELKEKDNQQDIKKVIKIIDKNLNNTDDWKLFEEAFNNADKDFLKLIKEKHPVLTPNDLRLCAYLRLNLSSKEIAPLLNISPRSVEVKRYRLRKKMDLPHESSLTNYILEI